MRRLILDANLLVLLIVGLYDPQKVGIHKRTKTFSRDDLEVLRQVISTYDQVVVTPNVLTEASNLLRQTNDTEAAALSSLLSRLVDDIDERFVSSVTACDVHAYPRLGLTDAGLLQTLDEGLPILTVDLDLYLEAARLHPDQAFNFNHMRRIA